MATWPGSGFRLGAGLSAWRFNRSWFDLITAWHLTVSLRAACFGLIYMMMGE